MSEEDIQKIKESGKEYIKNMSQEDKQKRKN